VATAKKTKTLTYKVSHNPEFISSVASKLMGREISFQIVPEDRTFEMTPTLRCRLGDNAFACFFYLDKFKSAMPSDLELVAGDIAQHYALECDDDIDTIIIAVTDTNLFSVTCNGITGAFGYKSKAELLSKMERSEVADKVRNLVREIAPSVEASQTAMDFASVLDAGSFEGLFCASTESILGIVFLGLDLVVNIADRHVTVRIGPSVSDDSAWETASSVLSLS
jgi:hypothetical protein